MSAVEDLRNSVKKELEHYDSFLSRAKDIVEAVPQVHEWREEAKTKWFALEHMPEEVLKEEAYGLLGFQHGEEKARLAVLPALPQIPNGLRTAHIASGSTAIFYESVARTTSEACSVPYWLPPISQAFGSLAAAKVQKAALPGLLAQIRPDLGKVFSLANASVDQAKNSIIGSDQAAVRMRDVVEQLWGALADRAKGRCGDHQRTQNLELKREANRHLVADCLSTAQSQKSLSALLDSLYSLHTDLSPESKNMLHHSAEKLESLHTRWILLLDAIVKSLNP
jgi:hypothetical protein